MHLLTQFQQLHDLVILHHRLDARRKARTALILAEADKALCDGADEELWILEVAVRTWKALA
jgi:replication factor C subunit 2/4